MRDSLLSISSVLIGAALLFVGNGLLTTLLAWRLANGDISPVVIGVVMSGYWGGILIGSLTARGLLESVGHIRTFAVLASTFSAATLAHAFLSHEAAWMLLRFLGGFCMAGLFMCMESWLNDRTPNQIRGQVFAFYISISHLGVGAGQVFLLADIPGGLGLFVAVSIMLSMALVPVALTRRPAPVLLATSPFGLNRLLAASPLATVGVLTAGLVLGATYALAPTFTHALGMGRDGTVGFMVALLLGGLLVQWPVGRLSDNFDRRVVLATTAFFLAIASGLMTQVVDLGPVATFALAGVFGGSAFLLYPLSVAHANDFVEADDRISVSAGLILFFSVGAIIGPMLASVPMGLIGPEGLFFLTAAAGVGMAVFSTRRLLVARPIVAEEPVPFAAAPQPVSPIGTELDPRHDVDLEEDLPTA